MVHKYLKRYSVSPDIGEMQLNHKEVAHLLLRAWLQPTPSPSKGASSQHQPRLTPIALISSAHRQHSPSWEELLTVSQDWEVSLWC